MRTISVGINWTKTAYCIHNEVEVPDNWDDMSKDEQVAYLQDRYADDPANDCYGEGFVTDWTEDDF